MIKRPLNQRFKHVLLAGRKITTIREKAWPVGVPIMLYHWEGLPYKSKHVDIAAVRVLGFWPIEISHVDEFEITYQSGMESLIPLWVHEGFQSQWEMDEWFRPLVPIGTSMVRHLMRIQLVNLPRARRVIM
jgi:hypothetical protein